MINEYSLEEKPLKDGLFCFAVAHRMAHKLKRADVGRTIGNLLKLSYI